MSIIAQAAVPTQFGSTYTIRLYSNGDVILMNPCRVSIPLYFLVFNIKGSYTECYDQVRELVRSATNSIELADVLNRSKIGYTNWQPVTRL